QGLSTKAPPKPPPPEWFRPPSDEGRVQLLGETVPEAFLNRVRANPRDVAVADDLAGVLTYERLLVGALVMSRRFAKLSEANVGLLLPASVASDVAFVGLQLAGKLPVLLNWTTGSTNLSHAARTMGLKQVVTSRQFLDRSKDKYDIRVEGVEFVLLED